jgi:hypothetical protein
MHPDLKRLLPMLIRGICLLLFAGSILAQDELRPLPVDDGLDQHQQISEIRNQQGRELNVISPTLAAQEIDRAVLNRLQQEIARSPEVAMLRLGVDEPQLQDIFIALSNARSFINGSEMANVRAMCDAWKSSALAGDARISEALDAYRTREKFTKDFIARYYFVLLSDIQSTLSAESQLSFNAYLDDRRRRMANAGAGAFGSIVQNVRSGAETVRFHCRR